MRKIGLIFVLLAFISLQAKDTRIVIDMSGRKVELPKEVKSVITVGSVPVINSFVMALGKGPLIANALPDFAVMPKWKYQYVFAPHLKNLTKMQGKSRELEIERIIAAKPDLILSMQKESADILEPKGLKVVLLKWRDIGDVKPMINLLGEIFEEKELAKEYLKYFDEAIKKASNITKNIAKDKKVKVLYASISSMVQPHLIAEWWIKNAGGLSVSDNGRKEERLNFSIEQLLAWNPDIIIVSNQKDIIELKSDKRLKTLKAVKNNKLFTTPTAAHIWANRTIEQPLTVLWALNKFYPKLYTESELKKDVHFFYKKFFKTNLSEAQVNEIITASNK